MIPTFVVIPTHNRLWELKQCVTALYSQVEWIKIVDNASDPMVADEGAFRDKKIVIDYIPDQPPNLSRLWNIGIDWAARVAEVTGKVEWNTVILNDDAEVSPGWVQALSNAMRETGTMAACHAPFGGRSRYVWGPGTVPGVATRLTGWAFMLRGEAGLRADEQFQWLCGDDDLSFQAREAGGIVQVPGYPALNRYPDQSTRGILAEIGSQDMQRFVDKYGVRPW